MDNVAMIHDGDRVIVHSKSGSVTAKSAIAYTGAPEFSGPYDVTPTVEGFDVGTRGKLMRDDMTVNPIPSSDVLNEAGGRTYSIAS